MLTKLNGGGTTSNKLLQSKEFGFIGTDPNTLYKFGNSKYKTFEGTEISIECVKAKVKDLVVEGKTIQDTEDLSNIESVAERENINLLKDVEWHEGWINLSTGELEGKNSSYPNARYSDSVEVDPNVLYVTNLTLNGGSSRLRTYAEDGVYSNFNIATFESLYKLSKEQKELVSKVRILILDTTKTPLPNKPYLIKDGEDIHNPYTLKLKINDIITPLNLPIPLRSLPNGVADTIEGNKLVQRVGIRTFDGSEDWRISSINNNENGLLNIYCSITDVVSKDQNKQSLMCDKYIQQTKGISYTNTEGVVINIEKRLYLRLLIDKATTVEKAKEYIKGNPFVVYYELAEPIIHDLRIPPIQTVKGTNIITTTNNIKPKLSMKVKVKK